MPSNYLPISVRNALFLLTGLYEGVTEGDVIPYAAMTPRMTLTRAVEVGAVEGVTEGSDDFRLDLVDAMDAVESPSAPVRGPA